MNIEQINLDGLGTSSILVQLSFMVIKPLVWDEYHSSHIHVKLKGHEFDYNIDNIVMAHLTELLHQLKEHYGHPLNPEWSAYLVSHFITIYMSHCLLHIVLKGVTGKVYKESQKGKSDNNEGDMEGGENKGGEAEGDEDDKEGKSNKGNKDKEGNGSQDKDREIEKDADVCVTDECPFFYNTHCYDLCTPDPDLTPPPNQLMLGEKWRAPNQGNVKDVILRKRHSVTPALTTPATKTLVGFDPALLSGPACK